LTAQMSDEVVLRDRTYGLTEAKGAGLFDPAEVGLHLLPRCTACWRGFVCRYELQGEELVLGYLHVALNTMRGLESALRSAPIINRVGPTTPDEPRAGFSAIYEGLGLGVPFTGEMLLGSGFIRELYVHMGFHPAWKHREVKRLTFEQGRMIEERGVSTQVAQIRAQGGRLSPRSGAYS